MKRGGDRRKWDKVGQAKAKAVSGKERREGAAAQKDGR